VPAGPVLFENHGEPDADIEVGIAAADQDVARDVQDDVLVELDEEWSPSRSVTKHERESLRVDFHCHDQGLMQA
jgi:hypothetical protein